MLGVVIYVFPIGTRRGPGTTAGSCAVTRCSGGLGRSRRAQEKLRSESAALAANEQDRAEAAQVLRDMETLRAW